ncbi:MAG: peptidylprolyl isomerase [Candidatus Kapabacteria bacterium]|nr:peptidylprolyl isomerase [Candidatus Kapabacteria bacterium]
MGKFEKIRKVSSYFIVVVAVLLVAYFVISGNFENVMRSDMNPQTAAIAIVNGEKILNSEFQKLVNDQLEQRRKQDKKEMANIDETQIRQQIFDQLVNKILLEQEGKKAGVLATDDEVRDILIDNPPDILKRQFPDSVPGRYNRALYLELMRNPENVANYMGKDPSQVTPEEKERVTNSFKQLIEAATDQVRMNILYEGIASALATTQSLISPQHGKNQYLTENSSAEVKFISINPNYSAQDVTVSDKDIEEYYEKNKVHYKQKEVRKIKYVNFPLQPSREDTVFANNNIKQINEVLATSANDEEKYNKFEKLLSRYYGNRTEYRFKKDIDPLFADSLFSLKDHQVAGPYLINGTSYFFRIDGLRKSENPTIHASHILIGTEVGKDSAKAKAQEIIKKLRDGEDFAKLAQESSKDKASAEKGGDLGWFTKGAMIKEFDSAAFNANINEIIGPVETQFGLHIIKVTDREEAELRFSEIKIRPLMSDQTKNNLKVQSIELKRALEAGQQIDELVKKINKNVNETPFFEKGSPVLGSHYISKLAFESQTSHVLEQLELKNYGLLICQVSDARQAGIVPLEDKKGEISRKLMRMKKLDLAKEKAEKVYQLVSSGGLDKAAAMDTLYSVKSASIKNNGMVPGVGMDVAFTANAFKLKPGEISKPVRGERGYFIIQVVSSTIPDENKIQTEGMTFLQQLSQTAKQQSYSQWYGSLDGIAWFKKLKENAKIEDNRGNFMKDY